MSLRANIEHLAHAPGIEAAYVETKSDPPLFRGAERWRAVLTAAVELQRLTNEPIVRLLTGGRTVMIQAEGREIAAVVLPTGHPAAKSVRRMIRRLARRVRKPLGTPAPAFAPPPASSPHRAAPTPPAVPRPVF